jgi:large subunit ribosomal protein L35
MPKMKSHSGAKKRFKLVASGKIKRAQKGKNHILNKKNRKRIRNLRQTAYVDKTQEKTIRTLVKGGTN